MSQESRPQAPETAFTTQDLVSPSSAIDVQKLPGQAVENDSSQRVQKAQEAITTIVEPTYGPRPDPFAREGVSQSPNKNGRRDPFEHTSRDTSPAARRDPFTGLGAPVKQVESQQMAAQLDSPGWGRLRHPLRNARTVLTLLSRQAKGEYDPKQK